VAKRSHDPDANKRCEFYEVCLEPKYNCNAASEADRYPIDYGHKYCVKFGQKSFNSQKGRDWRDKTLECLQVSFLIGGYMGPTNKGDCHGLTEFEFGEHARCYTQPGASICELARPSISDGGLLARAEDAASIAMTVDGKDLLSIRSGKQILQVLGTCSDQILKYAWTKMKAAGSFLADEAEKAYNAVAQGAKVVGQKIVQGGKAVGKGVVQGGKWVGNKLSQGWHSIFGLVEIRAQLQALHAQRHRLSPEHLERLDRLTKRLEALEQVQDAMKKNANMDQLPPNF